MAELKTLGRQIGQPSAPDISGAITASSALGGVIQAGVKTIGGMIEANRTLEEKALIANTASEFETSYIQYKNNSNINGDTLKQFNDELDAKISGTISQAPLGGTKSFISALETQKKDYLNKALDATLKQSLVNEKRDISLGVHELQNTFVKQIEDGDLQGATSTKNHLGEMVQALEKRGASAKELIAINDANETLGLTAFYNAQLKNATSEEQRTNIIKEMSALPDTSVNTKAFNNSYKEYGRINKLYKQAEDLSVPLGNILSDQNWKNRDLDKSDSNKLVDLVEKRITNDEQGNPNYPSSPSRFQAVPSYPGQEMTYSFDEDVQAENEGRKPNRYLVEGIVKSEEAPVTRESTIFDTAKAHVIVGSKNATKFPDEVTNILYGGPGDKMAEAVRAITYVEDANFNSLQLDDEADLLYSSFKQKLRSGRNDYDKMATESRNEILKRNKSDLKLLLDVYNSSFGLSGTGLKRLNKEFKSISGVDAIESGSINSLNDFNHILKSKYVKSDGNMAVALDATKREMSRIHGKDLFTLDRYIRFPPSKMLIGQNDTQIGNQFLIQMLSHAENNKNIELPENYSRIKTATEADLMNVNYASSAKQPSKNVPQRFKPTINLTQKIPGVGTIKGQLFVKSNEFTEQNDSGQPIWEAWMRDAAGNEYPIYDENSPIKNTLILIGKSSEEIAPNYTKNLSEEKIKETVNQVLVAQGKEIFPVLDLNPKTILMNKLQRDAYVKDLENQEYAQRKVRRLLGKDEE